MMSVYPSVMAEADDDDDFPPGTKGVQANEHAVGDDADSKSASSSSDEQDKAAAGNAEEKGRITVKSESCQCSISVIAGSQSGPACTMPRHDSQHLMPITWQLHTWQTRHGKGILFNNLRAEVLLPYDGNQSWQCDAPTDIMAGDPAGWPDICH